MKLNIQSAVLAVLLLTGLFACTKEDDYKKYTKDGEITYPGRVDTPPRPSRHGAWRPGRPAAPAGDRPGGGPRRNAAPGLLERGRRFGRITDHPQYRAGYGGAFHRGAE